KGNGLVLRAGAAQQREGQQNQERQREWAWHETSLSAPLGEWEGPYKQGPPMSWTGVRRGARTGYFTVPRIFLGISASMKTVSSARSSWPELASLFRMSIASV